MPFAGPVQVDFLGGKGITFAPPFSPATIAGLQLWVASDSGITLGTGNNITQWADKSSNHNNLTHADGSACPQNVAGGIAGKPIVQFNSASSQFFNLVATISSSTDRTEFVVWKKTAASQLICLGPAGVSAGFSLLHNSTDHVATNDQVDTNATSAVQITGNSFFTSAITPHVSGTATVWMNGVSQAMAAPVAVADVSAYARFGYGNGNVFSNGSIAEYVVYNNQLSTVNRQAVENYLAARYFVTLESGFPLLLENGGVIELEGA